MYSDDVVTNYLCSENPFHPTVGTDSERSDNVSHCTMSSFIYVLKSMWLLLV